MGKQWETVTDFIFLGSKITADGNCSHEMKRHLLLGRKAMENLNSILKSRDITLPTKICIVKAMVFPVVMYRLYRYLYMFYHKEGWTLKNWCFWVVVLEKILESPLNCKKIKSVNSKGNQPRIFTGRTDAEAEALVLCIHLMQRTDSLEKTLMLGKIEGRRRRGRQRMRFLDGITHPVDMGLRKLWEMVKNREAWHAAVQGVTKSQTWLWLNNNKWQKPT